MSFFGPCDCTANRVEYCPSTTPGRVDAAGPIAEPRVAGKPDDDAALTACIRHEAAHALAALVFHGTFSYVSIGDNGFHSKQIAGDRIMRPVRVIEEFLIDAAGHAAEPKKVGLRREPGIIEFGIAIRRDDDERGHCDVCSIARRINEVFPSHDDLVRLQTTLGVLELARVLFGRPMWRDALDRMHALLAERILIHGDEVVGLFDRSALLRDFEALIGAFDVLHKLPCFSSSFRDVERGRADRADAAPAALAAPVRAAGATYQKAR